MGKRRQGSFKSTVTAEVPSSREEQPCKVNFSNTKLLIVIESISGLEGSKLKGKQELKYPTEVKFCVSFGDEFLGSSDNYTIPDKEMHYIQYELHHAFTSDPSQALLSNPLRITMTGSGGKDRASKRSSSKGTRSTNKSGIKPSSDALDNLLIDGTIDLLPLIFGEIEVEEKVGSMLEVLVRLDGAKIRVPRNLLYVTVQSIYNPPLEFLSTETMGTSLVLNILPSESSGNFDDNKENDWTKLKFGSGHITSLESGQEVPTKKWFSVQNGPPLLSQYRNLPDEERVRDPHRLSCSDGKSSVYVNWNQISRVLIESQQQEKLIQSLIEDGIWQMEIYIKRVEEKKRLKTSKSVTTVSSKQSKVDKNVKKNESTKKGKDEILSPTIPVDELITDQEGPTYIVKFDLSELLHPGVNCSRVVGQLEKVSNPNRDSIAETTLPLGSLSVMSKVSIRTPSKADLLKSRMRDSKVQDFEGRPSYMIVLVELYSSFRPRKTMQELMFDVVEFVAERGDECLIETDSVKSPLQARAKYKTIILDNIHYLNTLYQEFNNEKMLVSESGDCNKVKEENLEEISPVDFQLKLEQSEAVDIVKRSINEAVIELLKDTQCSKPMELCETYCQLLEETQKAIAEGSKVETPALKIRATSDEILEAAREASEDGNFEAAEQYLLKRLHCYGKRDADKWRDVAVLCLRHGYPSRAKEALITVLTLQPRHRDGLLMMAVLSSGEGKHQDASTLFEALTTFYPRFYRGWFSYFCFFESIENKQGSEVCLSLGSVCLNDREKDEGELGPTYWCPEVLLPEKDGFILTAIYLLSLNLWQFAEMCLCHHRMEVAQDTVPYLYYLSVAHHLQGKFKESNFHIKQALSISWNDERLWNLMGHNLFRMQDWDRAVDCYQLILDEPYPWPNFSLTFYRMGTIMMNKNKYEEAAKYFLKGVRVSPSIYSWIGLAKASYWMGNINDSELAAREANRLDDQASDPWACLALVNIINCTEPYLAQQCLSLAQCGEIDEKLRTEIFNVINSYN